jgi:hypothetical protein
MKIRLAASLMATVLLATSTIASSDSGPSYEDTVDLIKKTLVSGDSGIRRESYRYLRFDKCVMEYNVLGTYPVGEPYDLKFSGIDFSSLNASTSKIGQDYTDFVVLSFGNPVKRTDNSNDMMIHTVVFNAGPAEKTKALFNAFLHLGELCRTPKNPL